MIQVTYSRERWEALSRRAREKFQSAAGLAKAGAGRVEEKTEGFRAKVRLEREMHDIRQEIDLQMRSIGELMYAAHKGTPSDSGRIQQILEYLDDLQEHLEACRQEWEAAQGLIVCEHCGAANAQAYVYCHNCGQPLSK